MNLSILGTGYVGLVTGTCFAELGHNVVCMDIIEEKIAQLSQGKCTISEYGLEQLIQRNLSEKRLLFTTNAREAVHQSDIIFLCLPTPETEDGHCRVSYLFRAAETIVKSMNGNKIIVNKSTVPPGTARRLEKYMRSDLSAPHKVIVASNPEFLREGSAVSDFMHPDRIVIGTENARVVEILSALYKSIGKPEVYTREEAECIKYAANFLLANRLASVNEVARLCHAVGADAEKVLDGACKDPRIGSQYRKPGPGFGGSCFPKDVKALEQMCRDFGISVPLIDAVLPSNQQQKLYALQLIKKKTGTLRGKQLGIWGLAFKADTDDMRESPALTILPHLLDEGATLRVHDPQAMENAKRYFQQYEKSIRYEQGMYGACQGSNALIVLTEWQEYKDADFDKIKRRLRKPVLVDLRDIWRQKEETLRTMGFSYECLTGKRKL